MTPLRDEIKQSRPFRSLEQEAHLNLERTMAALQHRFNESFKAHGITPTQYNVLRILRGAGEQGLCRNEVRDRMISPVPDATRLLDRLEAAGLIRRQRDTADRRLVTTHITDEGLRVVSELDEPVQQLHRQCLGHLSEGELRTLITLLERARSPD
jgi:DNA-binding MarR family transcriptional regulator